MAQSINFGSGRGYQERRQGSPCFDRLRLFPEGCVASFRKSLASLAALTVTLILLGELGTPSLLAERAPVSVIDRPLLLTSAAQVHELAARAPERIDTDVLAALSAAERDPGGCTDAEPLIHLLGRRNRGSSPDTHLHADGLRGL